MPTGTLALIVAVVEPGVIVALFNDEGQPVEYSLFGDSETDVIEASMDIERAIWPVADVSVVSGTGKNLRVVPEAISDGLTFGKTAVRSRSLASVEFLTLIPQVIVQVRPGISRIEKVLAFAEPAVPKVPFIVFAFAPVPDVATAK